MRIKKRYDIILYTYLVCLYPLLSMYGVLNTSISYAEILSFVFLISIIWYKQRIQLKIPFLFILFLIISHFLFFSTFYDKNQIMQMLGSTSRLLLIYFIINLKGNFFDYKKGTKIFIFVSVLSTIYLIIQYFLSKFGVYLAGGIPGLHILRDNVYNYINDITKYDLVFRARSIFEEPAHYCQYIIVAINLLLYKCDYNKKTIITTIFLFVGIILSMSLTGWILAIVSLIIWLISKRVKHYRKLIILLVIVLTPLMLLFFTNSSYIKNVYIRKFVDQNIAEDDRFSKFSQAFDNRTTRERMFGHGLITSDIYINGFPRIIYTYGVFGFLVLALLFIQYYLKVRKSEISKILLILLLVLSYVSEIIFGKYIVIYLIFCESNKLVNKGEKAS